MPCGLTNEPASFEEFINAILWLFLDIFSTASLDNILIYSDNRKEHQEYIWAVMTSPKESDLYLKADMWGIHKEENKYLELIVAVSGIRIELEKFHVVENWKVP
jgi:hypothetical protein